MMRARFGDLHRLKIALEQRKGEAMGNRRERRAARSGKARSRLEDDPAYLGDISEAEAADLVAMVRRWQAGEPTAEDLENVAYGQFLKWRDDEKFGHLTGRQWEALPNGPKFQAELERLAVLGFDHRAVIGMLIEVGLLIGAEDDPPQLH
jgi:hypothetical protein